MIDFYTWNTPNGHKVAIMLEETKLSYRLHPINLRNKEQFAPSFLKINPNNKIPAIVDQEGPDNKPINVFESGAILIYLGEKAGKFIPRNPRQRIQALEWLMFQMAGVGPMFGQLFHFKNLEQDIPYAVERYKNETYRICQVMNGHLKKEKYFAGEYSIADMAIFPWINRYQGLGIDLNEFPELAAWYWKIAERPAVQKALQISEEFAVKS